MSSCWSTCASFCCRLLNSILLCNLITWGENTWRNESKEVWRAPWKFCMTTSGGREPPERGRVDGKWAAHREKTATIPLTLLGLSSEGRCSGVRKLWRNISSTNENPPSSWQMYSSCTGSARHLSNHSHTTECSSGGHTGKHHGFSSGFSLSEDLSSPVLWLLPEVYLRLK